MLPNITFPGLRALRNGAPILLLFSLAACGRDEPTSPVSVKAASGASEIATATVAAAASNSTVRLQVGETTRLSGAGQGRRGVVPKWSSSNSRVATVNSSGLVSGVSVGSVLIRYDDGRAVQATSVEISLEPVVREVTIEAQKASLFVGEQMTVTAVARTASGAVVAGRPISWGVRSGVAVRAAPDGTLTGMTVGSSTVSATIDGVSGQRTFSVAGAPSSPAPTLTGFAISPKNVSLTVGGNQQFGALATWSDGGVQPISVSYVATGGTVSATGLFVAGQLAGTFMVIANCNCGRADTSNVVINSAAQLASLTLSPRVDTLQPNASRQFTVAALWSTGATAVPPVIWTAPGASIVGVTANSATYTAPATPGSYKVYVAHSGGGVKDSAIVVVPAPVGPTNPPPASGTILFQNNFDDGSFKDMTLWGGAYRPIIVDDPTSTNGKKSVKFTWTRGGERDEAMVVNLQSPVKVAYVRFRYKQDATSDNSGIKKTVRWRQSNGNGLSDMSIVWGAWVFYPSLGRDVIAYQTGRDTQLPIFQTTKPDSFRDKWGYVETMIDYSTPGRIRSKVWINDVLIIDYDDSSIGVSASTMIGQIWLSTVFNDPADNRVEWWDDLVVSTGRIGIP